ncbi:hypothetical protein QTP88_006931 [Uroleucon formosanum]
MGNIILLCNYPFYDAMSNVNKMGRPSLSSVISKPIWNKPNNKTNATQIIKPRNAYTTQPTHLSQSKVPKVSTSTTSPRTPIPTASELSISMSIVTSDINNQVSTTNITAQNTNHLEASTSFEDIQGTELQLIQQNHVKPNYCKLKDIIKTLTVDKKIYKLRGAIVFHSGQRGGLRTANGHYTACALRSNDKIVSASMQQIKENRTYMMQLIEIALFLSKQGIAFRGYRENEFSIDRGNFKETCQMVAKFDEIFANHFYSKTNYTSWSVQNTIIDVCAKKMNDFICNEIKECGVFNVFERFLTFLNVSEKQDADSLSNIMFNYLYASNIAQIPIVAQSCDGAIAMSGRFNGVQQKVKLRHPCAIYIHCMVHRVNVIDMCKIVKTRYVFNCLESIYIHFSMPTNNFKFKEIQKQLGLRKISITAISDTHWNCRVKNYVSQALDCTVKKLKREPNHLKDFHLSSTTTVDNCMKLNYDDSTFFIENYKELFNIDLNALKSEMMVVKNCVLRSNIELQIDFDKIKEVVQSEINPN